MTISYGGNMYIWFYEHRPSISHLLKPEIHIATLFWTFELLVLRPMVNFHVPDQRLLEIKLPIALKIFRWRFYFQLPPNKIPQCTNTNTNTNTKSNTWVHCSFLFITMSVSGCHRSKCWNWKENFLLPNTSALCVACFILCVACVDIWGILAQTLSIPEVFFLTQLISALQRLHTEMSLQMEKMWTNQSEDRHPHFMFFFATKRVKNHLSSVLGTKYCQAGLDFG